MTKIGTPSGTEIAMPCNTVPVSTARRMVAELRPKKAAEASDKSEPSKIMLLDF